jgi:hypothetical protein
MQLPGGREATPGGEESVPARSGDERKGGRWAMVTAGVVIAGASIFAGARTLGGGQDSPVTSEAINPTLIVTPTTIREAPATTTAATDRTIDSVTARLNRPRHE